MIVTFVIAALCATTATCALSLAGGTAGPAPAADPKRVDVVIQGAGDSEVDPLVAELSGAERIQIAAWTFWRGRLGGRTVVISRTEVGPINAVAATTIAILTFHPRLIINQGTAGATVPDLRVFDIVAGEATVDYGGFSSSHADAGQGSRPSNWMRMPHRLRLDGEERVPLPVFPGDPDVLALALAQSYEHGRVVRGVIGSAFQFNREIDRLLWIRDTYDAVSEDMESAFAAGAALGFNTPFLAIRIISDSDFHAPGIHPAAAGHCAGFVARLIARLPDSLLRRETGVSR
jgi:adenosylhomocysteine nucleosidase